MTYTRVYTQYSVEHNSVLFVYIRETTGFGVQNVHPSSRFCLPPLQNRTYSSLRLLWRTCTPLFNYLMISLQPCSLTSLDNWRTLQGYLSPICVPAQLSVRTNLRTVSIVEPHNQTLLTYTYAHEQAGSNPNQCLAVQTMSAILTDM
jgi:hypothetical protein